MGDSTLDTLEGSFHNHIDANEAWATVNDKAK